MDRRCQTLKIAGISRLSQWRKVLETHEILHGQLAGLVDLFEVFKYVVGVSVYHRDPEILIVFVLAKYGSARFRTLVGTLFTEYEFSASCDDPVAKMFGE